ncbi:PilZ domain-containing protein [Nitrospira sp. NS4]|uniref:PilZ domain-containing protein n=1 Tax=Nitrospira sp. NS4 TaxID=3414498 RepID=UPI003C2BF830
MNTPMKFTVQSTAGHKGKSLSFDAQWETVLVHAPSGDLLGILPWSAIIDRAIQNFDDREYAHSRNYPRTPLALKIRYSTPEGRQIDSLTGGIGGGGLFIESSEPLPPGTMLTVEFALPHRPGQKLRATGKVAWTRKKPERYLLFPGMGIQFIEIEEEAQKDLIELVEALNRNRLSS